MQYQMIKYVSGHLAHQIRDLTENVQVHEQSLVLQPNPIKGLSEWFITVCQRGIDWDFLLYDRRALILVYRCVLLLRVARGVFWRVQILLKQKRRCKLQLSWQWGVMYWGQDSYLLIVELFLYFARVGAVIHWVVSARNSGCLICHPRYPT